MVDDAKAKAAEGLADETFNEFKDTVAENAAEKIQEKIDNGPELTPGKSFDDNLDDIRSRTQKELEEEKAKQDKESEDEEPEPKKKITRKVIVRSISPEIKKLEEDKYVLEQAINCFPTQETFTYEELQKLFNNGEIQITIRR